MSRTGWFDAPLPRILAHRGLALSAPENSLEAFRDAIEAGATHIETDVRATLDGQAVLAHDPEVDGAPIEAISLRALRARAPHICTVGEAFEALPRARFNIDVKAAAAAAPLARAVVDAEAQQRTLIASFSTGRRRAATRMLAGVAVSASVAELHPLAAAYRLHQAALARRALRGIDAVQVPSPMAGIPTADRRFVSLVHGAGSEVHIWVVNDQDRMRDAVRQGVDGIVTDRTDLAAAALR